MSRKDSRVSILETFGINDPRQALEDAYKAVFGKSDIPPTRFDLTSVKVFKPRISIPTWLKIPRKDRKTPIYNFYNRNRDQIDDRYSVKVSNVRDFRGGEWTYDSHMGTDFAIPVGTHIVTCAPGKVMRVINQLDHGGLKIYIDHGQGLITTYGHLSRALVEEGDTVARGQSIALSGAAGIELILFFPWVAPHLHLNVLLNGVPIDPFAIEKDGELPMWIGGNDPVPHAGSHDEDFEETLWNEELVDNAISECTDPDERKHLRSIKTLEIRTAETFNYRMFYSTLFSSFPSIYEKEYERKQTLDLPFRAEDYEGAQFPNER